MRGGGGSKSLGVSFHFFAENEKVARLISWGEVEEFYFFFFTSVMTNDEENFRCNPIKHQQMPSQGLCHLLHVGDQPPDMANVPKRMTKRQHHIVSEHMASNQPSKTLK